MIVAFRVVPPNKLSGIVAPFEVPASSAPRRLYPNIYRTLSQADYSLFAKNSGTAARCLFRWEKAVAPTSLVAHIPSGARYWCRRVRAKTLKVTGMSEKKPTLEYGRADEGGGGFFGCLLIVALYVGLVASVVGAATFIYWISVHH